MKVIVLVTAAVTWPVSWFQYWDLFSLLCHGCTVCWAACLVMSVLHMPRVIRALSSVSSVQYLVSLASIM